MSTVLPTRSSDYSSAKFDNWPFLSVHFWGENPAGTWKFEITSGQQAGEYNKQTGDYRHDGASMYQQRHPRVINCWSLLQVTG